MALYRMKENLLSMAYNAFCDITPSYFPGSLFTTAPPPALIHTYHPGHSFIHLISNSFIKYVLSTYYVLDPIAGIVDPAVNKTNDLPSESFHAAVQGKQDKNT